MKLSRYPPLVHHLHAAFQANNPERKKKSAEPTNKSYASSLSSLLLSSSSSENGVSVKWSEPSRTELNSSNPIPSDPSHLSMLYHWYKRAARTGPGLVWSSGKQRDDESTTTTTTNPPPPQKNPKSKVRSVSQDSGLRRRRRYLLFFSCCKPMSPWTFPGFPLSLLGYTHTGGP